MKVKVTHLKAPWPEGAKVGDTVDLPGDAIPAWALGKCLPVPTPAAAEVAKPAEVPKKPAKG